VTDGANVLELVCDYLEQTYPTNANGRMRAETGAPLFVFARTTLGCVWRFREDLASTLVRDLARLAGREPPAQTMDPPVPPPERLEPMRRVLEAAAPEHRRLFHDANAHERFTLRDLREPGDSPAASAIADLYLI
jgi:hypothetical protein